MSVNLEKSTIIGKKGITVVYSINNFRFDSQDNKLKWDAFKFYTPEGNLEEDSFKYFDVSAEEYLIERHASLNKQLLIKVTVADGIEAIEIEEGVNSPMIEIGLEGDIIIFADIPTDTAKDITVNYKEVLDGNNKKNNN